MNADLAETAASHTNSAQQPTGSAPRQGSGPNGLAVVVPPGPRRVTAQGLPPQFAEALRRGTAGRVVRQWTGHGSPRSVRRAKKAKTVSLEPNQTNPTEGSLKVCAAGCGRVLCPQCRRVKGLKRRAEMARTLEKIDAEVGRGGVVWLWTLTTDPSKYSSPEEAWEHVTKTERVRKLAARMGWHYWTWVLEWHKSGWPHWHLMVYQPDRRRVEHEAVKREWRLGHVHYTRSDQVGPLKGRTLRERMRCAVNYVTKYLVKPAESKTPDWLLDSKTVIRMTGSSRGWYRARGKTSDEGKATESPAVTDRDRGRKERETHRDAMAQCGDRVVILKEYVTAYGEIAHEYQGRAAIPFRTVKRWASRAVDLVKRGKASTALAVGRGTKSERELRQFLDPHMI